MRRLHATGLREKFVASGVYEQPNGLCERWSVHEVAAAATLVRVDRDGRAAGAGSLLQEALRNADGHFERIDQQHYGANGRPGARLRYTRFAEHVELFHVSAGGPGEECLIPGAAPVPVPPGVLLAGMALTQALRMEQPVALLRVVQGSGRFRWQRASAAARCVARGTVSAAGRDVPARRCGWSDAAGTCWLDAHDIVLRCGEDACVARLTQYARRHG